MSAFLIWLLILLIFPVKLNKLARHLRTGFNWSWTEVWGESLLVDFKIIQYNYHYLQGLALQLSIIALTYIYTLQAQFQLIAEHFIMFLFSNIFQTLSTASYKYFLEINYSLHIFVLSSIIQCLTIVTTRCGHFL